jgi:hypothetical protein
MQQPPVHQPLETSYGLDNLARAAGLPNAVEPEVVRLRMVTSSLS